MFIFQQPMVSIFFLSCEFQPIYICIISSDVKSKYQITYVIMILMMCEYLTVFIFYLKY